MNPQDQSVVVMPAAHRPEFAALALEQLGKSRFCPRIHLNVDHVSAKLQDDFNYVWMHYGPPQATIRYRPPHIQVSSGCWNILESIRDGYNTGAEYVFLIEEDVLVMPDFFEYHWGEIARSGNKVSCGRRCYRFFPRAPWMYTNPGSCLTREFLEHLLPHVTDEFYKNTGGYLDKAFGQVEGIHGLDDGLIRRTLWKLDWKVSYPSMEDPKCAHVGFQAYENHYDFCHVDETKDIQGKIDNLRDLLKTIDRKGEKERYVRDLDPFPAELL